MSWVLPVWSAMSAVCFALAAIHGHVWWRRRASRADGAFSAVALSVAVVALLELAMMHARTPGEFGRLLAWYYLPLLGGTVATVAFVRVYLGAGRWWLGGLAIAARAGVTALGLLLEPNLHFDEVASLERVLLFGAPVSVPVGAPGPWMPLATLSSLVLVAFFVDAAATLWLRGERRRALGLSASLAFFVAAALTSGLLATRGAQRLPFAITPFFAPVLMLMGLQLSRELSRTARLVSELSDAGRRLVASQRRLTLAARAARAGFWKLDLRTRQLWRTALAQPLFESDAPTVGVDDLLGRVHPQDRPRVAEALDRAADSRELVSVDYRFVDSEDGVHWYTSLGRRHVDPATGEVSVLGMTLDITGRRRAEETLARQREELEHLSGVVTIGELSGGLAGELRQPLARIAACGATADAALTRDPVDHAAARRALEGVIAEVERAGQLVGRLRTLLRLSTRQRP